MDINYTCENLESVLNIKSREQFLCQILEVVEHNLPITFYANKCLSSYYDGEAEKTLVIAKNCSAFQI